MTHKRRVAAVLGLAGALAAGCSDGGREQSAAAHEHAAGDPLAAISEYQRAGGVLAQRGYSIGPIVTSGRYLFWAAGAGDEATDVHLLRRDLRTGDARVVAHRVFRAFGLAAAAGSVAYATQSPSGVELVAIDNAGGRLRVLSRGLSAPFDARGVMAAWPEADAARHRVVVRNMRTGRQLVVFDAPRCRRTRCYRIDRVTVADEGVVFALGAVGQGYPSLIGRRRWGSPELAFARVARDPQPDLARAAAGALYYQLGRGWMEWRFGEARPRAGSLRTERPWVVGAERGRQLAIFGGACETRAAIRVGFAQSTLPAPADGDSRVCRQLTGYAWEGNRVFLSWTLMPRASIEAHDDDGMEGVITRARVP